MASLALQPKMIVIVASKRHHIRFFPNPRDTTAADRNGNPFPGTLVEKDVTHPFENDFCKTQPSFESLYMPVGAGC